MAGRSMMKPSAPDAFADIDMDDYMTVLSIIANADSVLRPEEMSFFEWRMGRMLINPKLRVQFRALLRQEFDIEETIADMDIRTLRLSLRDGIFLAAADGEIHPSEVDAIRIIANQAGVDSERLHEMWEWVRDGMEWMAQGPRLLELPLKDD
jgi:tellurite resistance protein